MNGTERKAHSPGLEVRKVREADSDIIELLRGTILGSEGGMRYQMQNTPGRIRSYGDTISFMALYKRSSLKGVIGLCRRTISNRGIKYPSTYLRYLAVHSAFQAGQAPGRRKRRQEGSERISAAGDTLKKKILTLFSDPRLLSDDLPLTDFSDPPLLKDDLPVTDESRLHDTPAGAPPDPDTSAGVPPDPPPHVFYAYVESRNERSRNLINQAGYEYIRSFLTVAFSRFNPRPHPAVERLTPAGEPAMAALLNEMYRDYCFYTDQFSFHDHRYYVLRRQGEIVAGVGAIPAQYRVVNVPGVWGWLMMKVLPGTPLFRRLFQPEKFRYVILNAIYCRKGSESLLPDLFEAVCAEEGYNTALTWLDDHSQLYDTLRTNRRMGALNRMLNAKPGLVYALFSGLTPIETEKFYESPAYISGFDFS